ncbi:1771_t:CDS:1 [Funneliformis mosseae]|uniref:1771_t:CDS:1 n=1 Tax=Funneliformis mosseae TaxID=27381 RepID=A0A9N8WFM6_FUNMO|nr:1771_t:CDS:1 [Funneliformis mosseae]
MTKEQLPADCLNDIFSHLDVKSLSNCTFVNWLWCEISVRLLWASIRNFNTLIACLPNKSKEILYRNEIIISTPTSRHPLFNYVKFVREFSIKEICEGISYLLKNDPSQVFHDSKNIILAQEIFKMFMSQNSLKKFHFYPNLNYIPDIPFVTYPGAKNCLKNLSELTCGSSINPKYFYQLSQLCHKLETLNVTFEEVISNEFGDLLSVQQNLKHLHVTHTSKCKDLTEIGPYLNRIPPTLTVFVLYGEFHHMSLDFVNRFSNLRELVLFFCHSNYFRNLQYTSFPELRILEFKYECPKHDYLVNFLEINGMNLTEIRICRSKDSLNLAIAQFCPNLNSLYTIFRYGEVETLKLILTRCQKLESLKILCGNYHLNECKLLEIVANHSSNTFHELKVCAVHVQSELFSKELESILINPIPPKLISLVIVKGIKGFSALKVNMEAIETFINLGIIKNFRIANFGE